MSNMSFELALPNGYEIHEYCQKTDVKTAEKILTSRKQRKITAAARDGLNAEIYSHKIVCPHCSFSLPAYPRYLEGHFQPLRKGRAPVSKKEIEKWASMQVSFFDEEEGGICLNLPTYQNGEFTCPNCHKKSKNSKSFRKMSVCLQDKKITVKSELVRFEEIISLKLNTEFPFIISLPIYEKVVFDFESFKVYLELSSKNGEVYLRKSLTENKTDYPTSFLCKRLKWDKKLRRILMKVFEAAWEAPLPFDKAHFGFEEMVMMTLFVGFNREFYNAVPFKKGSFEIDKSFFEAAGKIRSVGDAILAYQKSSLPDIKSVKRIFFKTPGLLFYLEEAEKIWQITSDPNLFCDLLCNKRIYEFLSYLHQRPAVFAFFKDYINEMGVRDLISKISDREFLSYAVSYSIMNDELKEDERKSWHNRKISRYLRSSAPKYSIPMRTCCDVEDTVINGYLFRCLRSGGEYYDVGKKLCNCLDEWIPRNTSVFCVEKDGEAIAAIEVSEDKKICQARGKKNAYIGRLDKSFLEALCIWQEKYGINEEQDDFDDDEEGIDFEGIFARVRQ